MTSRPRTLTIFGPNICLPWKRMLRRTGGGARAPAALWLACVMAAVVESGGASSARDVRHGSRVSGLPSQQEDVGIFCEEGSGPWGGSAGVPMHGRGSALHGGSIYGLGAHTASSWVEGEDDTTTTGVSSDGVGAAEDVRVREVGSSAAPEEDRRSTESVTYDSESAGMEVQKHRKSTRLLRADGDLSEVVDLISRSKKILVVTGAGISASCGIPTFRGDGQFYDTVASEFGLPDGHSVMDIRFFREDPRPFYRVASRLYPSGHSPSPTHGFIKSLENAGVLLRDYTQNIDTLERHAGIKRVVYCHGSFAFASCQTCGKTYDGREIEDDIRVGKVPICTSCVKDQGISEQWEGYDGVDTLAGVSREWDPASVAALDGDSGDFSSIIASAESALQPQFSSAGIIKPDIVFFHEDLPEVFYDTIQRDIEDADLLLVMGTSLSVAPVSYIPESLADVPSIFINAEPVSEGLFDIFVQGSCDSAICNMLAQGLDTSLHMIAPRPKPKAIRRHGVGKSHGSIQRRPGSLDELRRSRVDMRRAMRAIAGSLGGGSAHMTADGLSRWLAAQVSGAEGYRGGHKGLTAVRKMAKDELQSGRGLDGVTGVRKLYRGAHCKTHHGGKVAGTPSAMSMQREERETLHFTVAG